MPASTLPKPHMWVGRWGGGIDRTEGTQARCHARPSKTKSIPGVGQMLTVASTITTTMAASTHSPVSAEATAAKIAHQDLDEARRGKGDAKICRLQPAREPFENPRNSRVDTRLHRILVVDCALNAAFRPSAPGQFAGPRVDQVDE